MGSIHRPVLVHEIAFWLLPVLERPGAIFVDGTAGGGGHLVALAKQLGPEGKAIGLDRDAGMLQEARESLRQAGLSDQVTLVHAPYAQAREVLNELGIEAVDALMLDLGLSSDQLASAERGFSFALDGPLDMRFDQDDDVRTAADLVNHLREVELANLFYEFGEERFSRRIARRLVEERKQNKISSSAQLAEIVRRAIPGHARHGPIDPATRVFQALRIAVNDELGQLDSALATLASLLVPAGRAAIISFHSLEDRRVKWAFKTQPELRVLTKKPITAGTAEVAENPRARSAKLRVVEKCPNPS